MPSPWLPDALPGGEADVVNVEDVVAAGSRDAVTAQLVTDSARICRTAGPGYEARRYCPLPLIPTTGAPPLTPQCALFRR